MNYEPGCPVRSLAGHDKDHYYIILTDEGTYVTVSDGDNRRVSDPKRKNKKHIQADKKPLALDCPVTDETIRRELEQYKRSHCSIQEVNACLKQM